MYRGSSVDYTNKKADVIAGAGENPAEYRNSLLALAANFIIVCVEIHHI